MTRMYADRSVRIPAAMPPSLFLPQKQAIFVAIPMGKHRGSVDGLVLRRIRKMKPGSLFTPKDLAELGSRTAVATALSRQLKAGAIRQPVRGLYYVPRIHSVLGELRATTDAIAKALAGKHGLKLQPSGAYAANLLGLSEQVPLRVVYLTDGTPRRVRMGKKEIVLRRTTPQSMATAGRVSGLVIQALRYVGKQHVDRATIATLRRRIAPADRKKLLADASLAPAWIAEIMREVASRPSQ